MDAAQTNIKKIAFILATALLLTAPFRASAQPTLAVSGTAISIGSAECNDAPAITVASSDGSNQPFTVAVQYANGNQFGNWLTATLTYGGGSTSTGTPFTAQTGTAGISLTLALNSSTLAGNSPPPAYVVLTPQDGTAVVTITVNYTQNAGCGGSIGTSNGYISVTPSTIALTAATNGQQSQTLTLQNNTGSGYTFTPTVASNGWLTVTASSITISAGGTTTVTVTGDATKTPSAGSYAGSLIIAPGTGYSGATLNIPVTFVVTTGTTTGTGGGTGSGTLTIANTSSNVFTTVLNYVAQSTSGSPCIGIQDTAAGANSYTTSVSTSNGGSWLLANYGNNPTLGPLAPGSSACVTVSLTNVVGTLPSGAYQGQVFVTSSSGATATLTVDLYVSAGAAPGITVQPGLIYQFNNVAPNSSYAQQEQFSITAAPGYTTNSASLSSSAGGFSMTTPSATNNTQTFTITSNSTGLVAGVYATTVTMQSSANGSTNTTTITLVLPVGQPGLTTAGNGGTGGATAVPASLAFQQQLGNSASWTGQKEQQQLTISGTPGTQWTAGIVYGSGSGWLTFDSANSGTFGNAPSTLLVDLFGGVTSLSPSSTPYTATIDINTANGATTYVSVSLLVTPQSQAVLLGYPASATFYATTGNGTPSQTVTIVGSDNPNSTTSPPLMVGTPTANWVTATANGNSLTISINANGQSTGIYSATIPVSATAYANPINYPVIMVVNGGGTGGTTGGGGPLTLSSTSLPFGNVTGSLSQNLTVSASTNTQFTLTSLESTCSGSTWLQVVNGTYTATNTVSQIPVTVNPSNIASGTICTGVITLVSTGSNGGTQTVNVSMTVGPTTGSGNVVVSPTTLTFAYTQNQTVPSAQTVSINNALTGTASIPLTITTTENSGGSVIWLQTSGVSLASTPYSLSVSVAPGSLSPGQYTGTVTITPSGGNQQTISVTLNIASNSVVTATPTNISLSYNVGGTSPTSTILVSAGGTAAAFTATAASTPGWLAVTPTVGITPNTGTYNLTVSAVSTVLSTLAPSATPYTGTITIQGVSPATGNTIVNVSLLVTAPLPVITGVINAASGATGAVSPGEFISIFGTAANPIGPATAVQLDSTSCPSPCTQVPTLMGGVQVKFLPGGQLAPLIYVGQSQINAIVPYGVAGQAGLSVEVLYLNQTSNIQLLGEVATAPGIFTAPGSSQAAAYQIDPQGNFSYNTAATPAKAGWTIVFYLTGEGVVVPAANTGAVTVAASTQPYTPVPAAGAPSVHIGNQPATLGFYGEAPNFVSGLMQLNVVVPAGAGTGSVPIVVTIGGNSTQTNVTVALQ